MCIRDSVFGAASPTFASLEDERHHTNVYAEDDVSFADSQYSVPSGPGLGLAIDTDVYQKRYASHEVRVT